MSHHFRNNLGFTLIELLVTIAIVTVMLTVVVLNQSTYTDNAALTNLADEIGLTFSQAQAYGVGVKGFAPGSSEFSASYGLSFNLLSSGSSGAYLSFADRNGDGYYTASNWSTCQVGGASECIDKVTISRGNYVESICAIRTSGPDLCDSSIGRLDIIFVRPSPEARIKFFNQSGNEFVVQNMKGAKVVLRSPRGLSRSVVVYGTGQISIQ